MKSLFLVARADADKTQLLTVRDKSHIFCISSYDLKIRLNCCAPSRVAEYLTSPVTRVVISKHHNVTRHE